MSYTNLSGDQVLKTVFDEPNQALRTSATIIATIGDINVDVILDYDTDSVSLGSNAGIITGTTESGKTGIDVHVINDDLAEIATDLDQINAKLVSGGGGILTTPTALAPDASTASAQADQLIELIDIKLAAQSIDAGIPAALGQTVMANSMPVVIASNQSPLNVAATLADEPLKISGTENGQPTGPEFTLVNNLRLQILAAKDREQDITYADFGTVNQRITQITYTSPSIGSGAGYTAVKTLSYTLVGNRYRRDSIDWSLI